MTKAEAHAIIREFLVASSIEFEEPRPDHFVVTLLGENKLKTTVSMTVGLQSLSVNAFVARKPDENVADVHAWLLERNRKMYLVCFSIDHLGDIYLTGRIPLPALTTNLMDQLLGAVLEYSDTSFNIILERGFETAIKREWQWRIDRGESTENLRAFRHLMADQPIDPAG
jgi:hypothetical protein